MTAPRSPSPGDVLWCVVETGDGPQLVWANEAIAQDAEPPEPARERDK